MKSPTPPDSISLLQSHVGEKWPAINQARTKAIEISQKLEKTLRGLSSTDASIVVFGSLARKEWTSKSDVDWTLLIDGQADPEHLKVAQDVAGCLEDGEFQAPGTTGIFGNMTFSHDLVQKIGGREDTNENTTRRVLLLQESVAFGKPDAYERVLRLILSRYLEDDRGLRFGTLPYKVPRFLLNDIVRYWRTITVDFVEKQRGQGGHGWGLRNAKLRMSRKLIFATGMLSCFSCELLSGSEARRELLKRHSTVAMEEHLRNFIKETPLEILATFLVELDIKRSTARKLFSAYNAFLALLNDSKKRNHLKNLHYDDIRGNVVFNEVRGFSREFQEGLTALFFNDSKKLRDLTIFYGVF
jgi:predicted nucleotidyltransferase